MAERHPWNAGTVGTVAGLAGVIGMGIGYGLAPKEIGSAVAEPVATEELVEEATPAAIPDAEMLREKRNKRGKRGKRTDRQRKRAKPSTMGVPSGPIDLSSVPGETWVTRHDPEQTWPGYTMVFYQRRVPMLIDMDGRIVHYWPDVRAVGRIRLTPQGHLVYIAPDDTIREVDWDGNLVREYKSEVEDRFPHHDLQWVPDGRIAAVYRTKSEFTDDIIFIDPSGELSWTWKSKGNLDDEISASPRDPNDLTHFNSVQVIPDNPHHRAGDARFKAGNVLISARNLSYIYMVDPDTGNVVWKYGEGLDWQHEAVLLGDDLPSAGNILLFNNRFHSEERRSEVIEINPVTNEVVWRYASEGFFSDTAGVAQKLPNGNVLITSSRGGRVFEVTAAGDVIWQWQPPYLPMRVNRYAPDYCPQLEAMGPPSTKSVVSQETRPYIDGALYDFKMSGKVQKIPVDGKKREVLTEGKVCLDVQFPGKPNLTFDLGFIVPGGDATAAMEGTITMTATPEVGEVENLYDKTITLAENGAWNRERVRVPKKLAYMKAELCVESTATDIRSRDDLRPGLVVGMPKIMSGYRTRGKDLPNARDKKTQKAEQELQQRQLEALGYIE